jgi:hypothetical protein
MTVLEHVRVLLKLTRRALTIGLVFAVASCGSAESDAIGDASRDDAASVDSAPTDGRTSDSAPADGRSIDSTAIDARFTDSAPTDGRTTDSAPTDGRTTDVSIGDSSTFDVAIADATTDDSAPSDDSATTDSGTADSSTPDSRTVDAAITDASSADATIVDGPDAVDADDLDGPAADAMEGDGGTHGVTVTIAGNGSGAVVSSPAGIDCGTSCTARYPLATLVTLEANPAVGSTFTGWSGGGCSGTATCQIAANDASMVTVSATFALLQHTLSVGKSGAGTGTVSSNPAGIDCGATCSAVYNHGTVVSLFAISGTSGAFMGWSGSCAGTGACSITMISSRSVSASFVPPLSCTTVNTALNCTNGSLPQINLGQIASATCHDRCQIAMRQAGMTTGCWLVASDGNCYCRSGSLNGGGTRSGGFCN